MRAGRNRHLLRIGVLLAAFTACNGGGGRDHPPSLDPAAPSPVPASSVHVYFNDPLATLPQRATKEAPAGDLAAALIQLLDSARQSIDAAIYHVSAPRVINALGRACRRGVQVRLLIEEEARHAQRYPSCVAVRPDKNQRLMHDKFAIVDGSIVWTGSTNWTDSDLELDANNAVTIRSRGVARAYEAEFEQMFNHRRFGMAKANRSPERFQVGTVAVEVYFSPADRPARVLRSLIRGARRRIQIALFTLTQNTIYDALLQAHGRGVSITAVWDFSQTRSCQVSKVDDLLRLDRDTGVLDAYPGLLHDKYAVIDGAIVVTGSANWSASGLGTSERGANDEDLLVLHSREIAAQYAANFSQLYQDAVHYDATAAEPPRVEIREFQSAGNGTALVTWRPQRSVRVTHYEICRALSPRGRCQRRFTIPGRRYYFVDRGLVPGGRFFYRIRSERAGRWTADSNVYKATIRADLPVLSAEQAKHPRYRGRTVSVRFRVANTPKPKGKGGHVFLDAGRDYKSDFTAFIPGCALPRLEANGAGLRNLHGTTMEVTGELHEYHGPEIVVTEPWQLHRLRD